METFQASVACQDGERIAAAVQTLGPSDLPPPDSLRPRHLDDITSDVDVKDVIAAPDQLRARAFSGHAVVRVVGGF